MRPGKTTNNGLREEYEEGLTQVYNIQITSYYTA